MKDRPRVWTPEWREAEESGSTDGLILCKRAGDLEYIEKEDGEPGSFQFVISSEAVDRYGDVIRLDGWKTDNFFRAKGKGPVLWAHRSDEPQFVLGTSNSVTQDGANLIGAVDFYPEDINANATKVAKMAQLGGMSASVGFDPLEMEPNEDTGGFTFLSQDLLEFSVVPVPANPEAVPKALAKGLDLGWMDEWARQTLDELHGGSVCVLDKDKLEAVVKALGYGRGMKFFDLGTAEIKSAVKAKVTGEPEGDPVEESTSTDVLETFTGVMSEFSSALDEQTEAMQFLRAEVDQIRADLVADRDERSRDTEDPDWALFNFEPDESASFSQETEPEPSEVFDLDTDLLKDELRELIQEAESRRTDLVNELKHEVTQLTGRVVL